MQLKTTGVRFPDYPKQTADCSVSRYARNKLLFVGLQSYSAQTANCDFFRVVPLSYDYV
jgi:hypothetical protein